MKKSISVFLCLVMALCCVVPAFAEDEAYDSFGAYKHVFIIGVDGAGAFFEQCDTPNFDRIFADNAYRHNAHTEYITTSAQNWGSILTGVDYETHGYTNDSTAKTRHKSSDPIHSIFYYTRQAMPNATLVSFNNWSNINHGIIENDLGVLKVNRKSDALVTDAICRYFEQGKVPTLMFVQLDSVDHAGHSYGRLSDEYREAIEKIDVKLGAIYDAIDNAGLMKDSLFILVADHGHTDTGGHGGQTIDESSAVLAVAGHSVNKTILPETAHNRDVSAIALYALGIPQPSQFISSVPEGLFGESREKTVAPNPISDKDRLVRNFLYFWCRLVNMLCGIFDGLVK